nr:hypothetical protein [Tanacetum cinerariifolium]GEZ12074.1 hypothetical protein [Tanacetum cinerariifolium]
MGDEHLNTIPTTESDEFIKSCVEKLVPNPSESEGENECDAGFTTFSDVLFSADYNFDSGDDQSTFDENFPKKIYSNPLFDEEIDPMKIDQHSFNAESGIDETDCHHEKETRFAKRLFDSHMEEIDLPFTPGDPLPSGIEDDDYDSGRDIPILEELLDNYSFSLAANESYHFDIPSPYCPPAKPPDGNTRTLNIKMMGDVSDQK